VAEAEQHIAGHPVYVPTLESFFTTGQREQHATPVAGLGVPAWYGGSPASAMLDALGPGFLLTLIAVRTPPGVSKADLVGLAHEAIGKMRAAQTS
jgi:hypothetical protein